MLVRPLLFATPLSHDHPAHLFKAWHFWTEMLGRFRVGGWSHIWGFGGPADELVPPGAEMWVALFRAATLGLLSWMRTYAGAFAAVLAFTAWANYRFGRHFFGPMAGLLSSLIAMLDPGGWAQGGWTWHTDFGVWPVTLAMSFAILAFVKLDEVATRGRTSDVVWAGLLVAGALLTHQLPLMVFAVAIPLLALDILVRTCPVPRGRILLMLSAAAFGVGLSAFATIPLLARSDATLDLGVLGLPLQAVVDRLLNLDIFDAGWRPLVLFGILGGWLGVRSRRPGAVFVVSAAALCLFLSSDATIRTLHLERLLPTLVKVEGHRMMLAAKLFWLPLAGFAMVALIRMTRTSASRQGPWKWLGRWGVVLGLTLVFVPNLWTYYKGTYGKKPITTQDKIPAFADLQAFFAWSKALRQSNEDHYRIAYYFQWDDHLPLIAPVFNGTHAYKIGYTPSQIFRLLPMSADARLLQALNVRYVLADHPVADPHFVLERRFGSLSLFRVNNYHPEPFTMLGPGRARLWDFDPEHLRFDVQGTSPESRLKIHVAYHDRWQATVAGRRVPVHPAPVFGAQYEMVMQVDTPVSGTVVLDYVPRLCDWLGRAVTLATLPLFLVLARYGARYRLLSRIRWSGRPRVQRLLWVLGLLGAALTAIGVSRWMRTPERLLRPASLFRTDPSPQLTLRQNPCKPVGKLVYQCGPERVAADVIPGLYGSHGCVGTTAAGPLQVAFRAKLGRFLQLRYDPGVDYGHLRVSVDGQVLLDEATRPVKEGLQFLQVDTRAFAKRPASRVELVLTAGPMRCFDVTVGGT